MVLLPTKKKNRNRPRRSNTSSRLLESNGPDIKIKGSSINENQLKNVLEYCRLNEISLLQFKSNLYQKKNITSDIYSKI